MTLSYITALRNAKLDAITAAIGNAGLLRIYDGTPPASANAALSGNTLLAELTCGTPFAPSAASGVLTPNSVTGDSSANATGTASFFRVVTSGGTVQLQGTVGTSGADLNLNTVSIVSGATVNVTSWTITAGNA